MVSSQYGHFYEFVNSPFVRKLYRIRHKQMVFLQYVFFDVPTCQLLLVRDYFKIPFL